MKQSIQLRLGQQLTMTPQLQQAIRLLQLSTMELQTEIQEILEANPLLEADENLDKEQDKTEEIELKNGQETDIEFQKSGDEDRDISQEESFDIDMQQTDMPDDLPVDSAWEDVYENVPTYTSSVSPDDDRFMEIEDEQYRNLHEYLQWQMNLLSLSDVDKAIAETIIDSIDDDGYLDADLADIAIGIDTENEVTVEEVEAVLYLIQNCEPAGVAARDLRECLLLQLGQCEPDTPWLKEAIILVDEHMPLLAGRDFSQLARKLRIPDDDLIEVIKLIRSMNPRPGSQLSSNKAEYIIPDVYVRKIKGVWRVELNPDAAPKLKINPYYASLIRRSDNSQDNTYLKNQLQEARWFLKSLQSRNDTLLKVATSIIEHQRGFLEHGEEAMKALVLHDIAEEVGMHESTISRVTTRKYMHTPRGIFELKYFFSSHVSTSSGGEASSTAIRALIKKLIDSENNLKPFSDNKIASLLAEQGINVARRTVAKYREAMKIPPSNERKQLI